jgi:hypothetical protein
MPRRILVVATAPLEEDALRKRVREHAGMDDVEVRVIAPAVELSPLEWLASDEDEARDAAAGVAREAKQAVQPAANRVETEVGDTDPLQAIEDALRRFPADEVIMVTRPEDEARWLEEGTADEARERFRVPVIHMHAD